eukprot:contig_19675_g4841
MAPAAAAATLRTYGLSAVLAYGLFDAVTYSLSAVLAARAYLAAGGVWGWAAAPKIFAGMWLINNVSRPLRVAGALALAPVVERCQCDYQSPSPATPDVHRRGRGNAR